MMPEDQEHEQEHMIDAETDVPETGAHEVSVEETVLVEDTAPTEVVPVVAAAVVVPESDMKWYSLRVISGKENKIVERIRTEVERNGWSHIVRQAIVPTEKVMSVVAGKKKQTLRNLLPGYILVEADPKKIAGDIAKAIADIPNVIHFLGKESPIPMQNSEANRLLGKVDALAEAGEVMLDPFLIGETIKVVDGPFAEFIGDIQEINMEKKKLKVVVKIFGRGTEVELNFTQVERAV
jgi:transcription termination/antitermination protein NusG